jgi:hypothetical protein
MKIKDILEKAQTISSSSKPNSGGLNLAKAEKIVDPKGFFAKNKRKIKSVRK